MLEGIVRESMSTGATKALRRDGYLIANIYGKGLENINAAFKSNEYIRTVRNKETIAFPVTVAGQELSVVVQGYESHAVTGNLLHVDLMVAQAGVESKFNIPIVPVGEAIGLKNKGLVHIAKERLTVKCTPENLMNKLEIDVTEMDTGDSKLVRDLPELPNMKIMDADRVALVSIIKAK
ncbi:50S ribosomal protein L25/general stress protein Ctc [Sulfurimonas sp. SAG-AH-194-L11]|nr:50S ribosomal protein L25/general stress protein Ctc [Sulfurimonas sp. SAG-AH-194-L11]MDF1876481.1 50S ribosomal protein L25/general stress protein Ctc [Sulfurimonas sp. SAG-AH-194-L11]